MITATLLVGFFDKLWHWLDAADKVLFLKINVTWTSSFWDSIFPWYRDSITWLPLYIFLLLFITFNYGSKSLPWIIGLIVTAALSDQISSSFLKNAFERTRPCNDIFMQLHARLLISRCPSSFSFTSSHATNHFAAAMFIFFTLKPVFKKWTYLFFFWAATISYGQVYIGVHYPIDIVGGCIIGCIIGFVTSAVFNKYFLLPHHQFIKEV
jgi:undecaprenyl-diphosphatase